MVQDWGRGQAMDRYASTPRGPPTRDEPDQRLVTPKCCLETGRLVPVRPNKLLPIPPIIVPGAPFSGLKRAKAGYPLRTMRVKSLRVDGSTPNIEIPLLGRELRGELPSSFSVVLTLTLWGPALPYSLREDVGSMGDGFSGKETQGRYRR